MYLKRVVIENIKSITSFVLDFEHEAGWHVLLGDNGSGKSTVLKIIVVTILGEKRAYALQQNFSQWVRKGCNSGTCSIDLLTENLRDEAAKRLANYSLSIDNSGDNAGELFSSQQIPITIQNRETEEPATTFFEKGFFIVAFGSYRQIGERSRMNQELGFDRKVGAYISLFKDNYSLVSAYDWLMDLQFQVLDNQLDKHHVERLKSFFNTTGLLPEGVVIHEIGSKGITFNDINGNAIDIHEMSDGYKSIFTLVSETIRQMTLKYGIEAVLQHGLDKNLTFQVPGVVLIDEIDIHLHPTWQVRIGNWFKKYFPKIQFIVTTHSPLICQSAEGGSIWKMEHSSTKLESRKLVGEEFNRLVYGDILEAFGTELFGKNVCRNEKSNELLDEMARLNMLKTLGKISDKEEQRLVELQKTFTTNDSFEF